MKRTRGEKERWEDFETRVGIKRSGGGKKETRKAAPNDILVQRMSSTASGRLKKFEPLDTRDFVPFGEYDDLTIETLKKPARSIIRPRKALVIFWHRTGDLPAPNLTKLKGKRFTLFVSFNQSLASSQKQVSHCLRKVLHHPSRLGPRQVQ